MMGKLAVSGAKFQQPKPLLLLAYLTVEGPQSRRHLAELFWPGEPKRLRSLTAALVRLRQGLPGAVEADEQVVLAKLSSDVHQILAALDDDDVVTAAKHYQGPFLAGFHLPGGSVELEEWVYATREFLAEKVQKAYLTQAESEAAQGDFMAAAKRAEVAYALPGAPEPSPEWLESYYALLLAGDSPVASQVRKEAEGYGIALSLSRSQARERFGQNARFDNPGGTKAALHNLPSRATSFVGRDPELIELGRLLSDESTRLVTITGAGGTGKSRLALEAAWTEMQARSFPDGAYFVSLEALDDPENIPAAVAGALDLKLAGRAEPLAEIAHALKSKKLLLVLDNYEHLVSGAVFASELVRQCAAVKLLVTSRERLDLEGEQILRLEGLPFATDKLNLEGAEYQDSLQLFVQRAKRVQLDFGLSRENLPAVLTICQLVQGSPLGIELAAPLVRLLSVQEIATEVERSIDILAASTRDAPERQRSLRATFEYSWRLLSDKEQATLRRLSVFIGGFTRQAAAEVAGATIPLLASLVDKSLLRTLPGGRFDRHPLLYEYTQEKLAEAPLERSQVQALHAGFFLGMAEQAEAKLQGVEQAKWLKQLQGEQDNLRSALHWMKQHGEAEMGLRLAAALRLFWHLAGHASEGRAWLDAFLSLRAATASRAARARALNCAGELASRQGDLDHAQSLLDEALPIMRALGDDQGIAKVLNSMGNVALLRADHQTARSLLQESLGLRRTLGDIAGMAGLLNNLGIVAKQLGDLETARALHEESLSLNLQIGNKYAMASALLNLGTVMAMQDDDQLAQGCYEKSLALGREIDDSLNSAFALNALGLIAAARGEFSSAQAFLEESAALSRENNDRRCGASALNNLGMVAVLQSDLPRARALFSEGLNLRREISDRWGMAYSLIGFAALAVQPAGLNAVRAAQLAGSAETAFAALGTSMERLFQVVHEKTIATARSQLGHQAFAAAWADGARMSLDEAVLLALDDALIESNTG